MKDAVHISQYPLQEDMNPHIKDVIERLKSPDNLYVDTNSMSTQIRGEYDDVMAVMTSDLKTTFEQLPKGVFVIKMLNKQIAD